MVSSCLVVRQGEEAKLCLVYFILAQFRTRVLLLSDHLSGCAWNNREQKEKRFTANSSSQSPSRQSFWVASISVP